MAYQRARRPEQKEERREAILAAARALASEQAVRDVSLGDIARRVDLAKSNVLRYFESREAVLLELLDRAFRQWVDEVTGELSAAIDPKRPGNERGDALAAVLARSLVRQPVLCDLISSQPGVLEQNVSVDVVVRIKRSGLDGLAALAEAVRRHVPELGEGASELCLMAVVIAGALWTHARPAPSALAAYEVDPTLADLNLDLPTALERTLATLITGTLARSPARAPRRRAARSTITR
jgi:AcrR family transcriptional regulator